MGIINAIKTNVVVTRSTRLEPIATIDTHIACDVSLELSTRIFNQLQLAIWTLESSHSRDSLLKGNLVHGLDAHRILVIDHLRLPHSIVLNNNLRVRNIFHLLLNNNLRVRNIFHLLLLLLLVLLVSKFLIKCYLLGGFISQHTLFFR